MADKMQVKSESWSGLCGKKRANYIHVLARD